MLPLLSPAHHCPVATYRWSLARLFFLCHCMQARRNVVTYKSRNRRKPNQDDEKNHALTSPLSEVDKDEVTLPEMNRRMGKRSRLLAVSSVPDFSAIVDTSKGSPPMRSSKRPRVGNVTSNPLSTVFNAELHANSFQTLLTSALPSGKHRASGSLDYRTISPFSPASFINFSSNAKENLITSHPQTYLASPFNSHPNSRNVSPTKTQFKPKPTKRPRAKSRTLSAHLSENRDITGPATDAAPSPDRKKVKTLHHSRNPSLPSFAVDDPPDWLNYAEAKPRKSIRGSGRRNVRGSSRSTSSVSSSGSQPRPQLLPIHHSSFLLESPLAFSTPPTNRRLDRSPQDFVAWCNVNLTKRFLDTDTEDEDEDVEMADAGMFTPDSASRAPCPTRTRRQTVHISHDSLFSSMEISDSVVEPTITGIPANASGANTMVDQNTGDELSNRTALTSAMSLTGILEPTDTNKLPTLGQALELTEDDTCRSDWMADEKASNAVAGALPKERSTHKKATTCLDDLEVLGARVAKMNLEGFSFTVPCSGSRY